jgi:hypothetical protein
LKNVIIVLTCLIFICSCSTLRLTKIEDVSLNEAAAIVKINLKYNGEDVTKKSYILFNAPSFGAAKHLIPDENGYIYAKLPLGTNSIDEILLVIGLGNVQHRFNTGELTFQLNQAQAIYYLGDLTIDWQGVGSGTAATMSIGLGVVGSLLTQGDIIVSVESNINGAQEAFRKKFQTQLEIIPSLVVVKPTLVRLESNPTIDKQNVTGH